VKLQSNVPDILCNRRPGQFSQCSNWNKGWMSMESGLNCLPIKLIHKLLHWTHSGLCVQMTCHLNPILVYLHGGMHNRLNPGASWKALKLFSLSKHCTSVSRIPTGYLIKQHSVIFLCNGQNFFSKRKGLIYIYIYIYLFVCVRACVRVCVISMNFNIQSV